MGKPRMVKAYVIGLHVDRHRLLKGAVVDLLTVMSKTLSHSPHEGRAQGHNEPIGNALTVYGNAYRYKLLESTIH